MAAGDAYVFPGFLTPVLTQLFYTEPPTTFLTCFFRGERRKYAGKKTLLNRGSNSQPPGHESDMLTTEPARRGYLFSTERVKPYTTKCPGVKICLCNDRLNDVIITGPVTGRNCPIAKSFLQMNLASFY